MTSGDNLDADYYSILGIQIGATDSQINAAYKRMMLEWHPDRHRNKPPTMRNYAGAMAAMLNEAREVLTNPRRRAAYDAEYRRQKGHNADERAQDSGQGQSESRSQQSRQGGSEQHKGSDGNGEKTHQHSANGQSAGGERGHQRNRNNQTKTKESKSEATFRAGQRVYEGATEEAGRGVGKTIVIIVFALVALGLAVAAIYGIVFVAVTAVTAIFDFLTSAVQAFFNFMTTLLTYLVALAIIGGFLFAMYKMRE